MKNMFITNYISEIQFLFSTIIYDLICQKRNIIIFYFKGVDIKYIYTF